LRECGEEILSAVSAAFSKHCGECGEEALSLPAEHPIVEYRIISYHFIKK
jgi:hypothetical protein